MNRNIILITNDDGIESPGLKAAAEAVFSLGEVVVIAPTTQQTGTGRGLTGNKGSKLTPTRYTINGTDIKAFHIDCSPALIVKHGINTIFNGKKPSLAISGINYGENLGSSITCSGTVGAALEAASVGIPSIAISKQTDTNSHHTYTDQDWFTASHFLHYFAKLLLAGKLCTDVDALKIDVPEGATTETEWKLTKVARSGYYFNQIDNPSVDNEINAGKTVIRIDEDKIEIDTDIHTFGIQKLVSVAPLSIDLSSRVDLDKLQKLYLEE